MTPKICKCGGFRKNGTRKKHIDTKRHLRYLIEYKRKYDFEYRAKNRERMRIRDRALVMCECGIEHQKVITTRHRKTNKHWEKLNVYIV